MALSTIAAKGQLGFTSNIANSSALKASVRSFFCLFILKDTEEGGGMIVEGAFVGGHVACVVV